MCIICALIYEAVYVHGELMEVREQLQSLEVLFEAGLLIDLEFYHVGETSWPVSFQISPISVSQVAIIGIMDSYH